MSSWEFLVHDLGNLNTGQMSHKILVGHSVWSINPSIAIMLVDPFLLQLRDMAKCQRNFTQSLITWRPNDHESSRSKDQRSRSQRINRQRRLTVKSVRICCLFNVEKGRGATWPAMWLAFVVAMQGGTSQNAIFSNKNPENADNMPDRLARSRSGRWVAMPSQLHAFYFFCNAPI